MEESLVHNEYHSHVLGCFYDFISCFYGFFCPCCLSASNFAAIRKENCTVCHCLFCFSPFWVRQMVQEEYNIKSSYCADCVLTTFCFSCAICQDTREINWKRMNSNNDNH